MNELPSQDVTLMLQDWSEGDREVPARLIPLIYGELRRLAASYLQQERPDHTLQPTALVHEAYVRLAEQNTVTWHDRAHFFRAAAQVMRHILVDHARRHRAAKRGGPQHKLALDEAGGVAVELDPDLLALDEALHSLAKVDRQQSRVVELRFFGGLTVEEAAEALGISPATLKREWRLAKAWLLREMTRGETGGTDV